MNNQELKKVLFLADKILKEVINNKKSYNYTDIKFICNGNIEITNMLIFYLTEEYGLKYKNGVVTRN